MLDAGASATMPQILGSGATATVYATHMHDPGSNTSVQVAVKVFARDYVETWQREVRACGIIRERAMLLHVDPPIIRMIRADGWVTYDGLVPSLQPCILYEYMGSDLSTMIRYQRDEFGCGLPIVQTLQIGLDVAYALEFLHKCGIVHTDVKTGNVLLTHVCGEDEPVQYHAKLGDFGTSSLPGMTPDKNVGTVEYCAPEVTMALPYGFGCDIWAFGCTLFRIATLCHLFDVYDEDGCLLGHDDLPVPADDSASAESSEPVRYRHMTLCFRMLGAAPKQFVQRCRKMFTSRGQPIDHPDIPIIDQTAMLQEYGLDAYALVCMQRILHMCIQWMPDKRAAAADIAAYISTQLDQPRQE